ncbi:MAG: hypothetical protein SFX73_38875 [Kofleriaceae bacterium]|nr:hypothetical protein [Kofleriaceae bacterium]
MKILVYAHTSDPHRQSEALRAALGVTLRGAEVDVVLASEPLTPLAQRAATTLQAFGHTVGSNLGEVLDRADVVEVWGPERKGVRATCPAADGRPERRTLHLVRPNHVVAEGAVADGDDVVYLEGADHDLLLARIFTADRVITW